MTRNNQWLLAKCRNKKAFFITANYGGEVEYIASNRAARRFINSKHVIKFAQKHGVNISFEETPTHKKIAFSFS